MHLKKEATIWIWKILAAGMVASLPFGATASGELEGLREWYAILEDEREPSYALVRCAGLSLAVLGYAGTKALGEETSQKYKDVAVFMSAGAAMIRSERSGGDLLDYEEQVRHDRERIFHLYVDRMEANYAASGQAIMNDDLLKSDLTICGRLAERAMK